MKPLVYTANGPKHDCQHILDCTKDLHVPVRPTLYPAAPGNVRNWPTAGHDSSLLLDSFYQEILEASSCRGYKCLASIHGLETNKWGCICSVHVHIYTHSSTPHIYIYVYHNAMCGVLFPSVDAMSRVPYTR